MQGTQTHEYEGYYDKNSSLQISFVFMGLSGVISLIFFTKKGMRPNIKYQKRGMRPNIKFCFMFLKNIEILYSALEPFCQVFGTLLLAAG